EGTGLSKEKMIDVIRHERRVELAFEGLRFYDLKRWGKMPEAYQRMIADATPGFAPVYRQRRSETLPIPQRELDVNKSLQQNEAWK
ncbi:MAG: hypothetical protein RIR48_1001, partial [Bacteroidota bacterium]